MILPYYMTSTRSDNKPKIRFRMYPTKDNESVCLEKSSIHKLPGYREVFDNFKFERRSGGGRLFCVTRKEGMAVDAVTHNIIAHTLTLMVIIKHPTHLRQLM